MEKSEATEDFGQKLEAKNFTIYVFGHRCLDLNIYKDLTLDASLGISGRWGVGYEFDTSFLLF